MATTSSLLPPGLLSRLELKIESLDSRGRGIATYQDRSVVCDGALPGETITLGQLEQRRKRYNALTYSVVLPAPTRISPLCHYYGDCGGCQLQHASYEAQLVYKENLLKQIFTQYAGLQPDSWLPSLFDTSFHYRRRVRLSVRLCSDTELIIGFHRKSRSYILDISACPILDPRLEKLLSPLHELIEQLSFRHRMPQIEMCCGDRALAIVFRHLLPLAEQDRQRLLRFANTNNILIYTQKDGPDTLLPLFSGQADKLQYCLPAHQITLQHLPVDFVQANARLNHTLVDAVISHLDIRPDDVVLDLFSGIGNFSLPVARYAQKVIGIEGNESLVVRANENAQLNKLRNLEFQTADLTRWTPDVRHSKLILNPPREGAIDVIKRLQMLPDRIVYVSCMPRTLARDAGYLVHHRGYRLSAAGLVDMFPQTRHIEAIAVFDRWAKV